MKLIFHGDDFGLTSGVNRGIIHSFSEGLLTSASLIAAGEAAEEAMSLARDTPGLDIGVHLTLCDERPVIRSADLSSLIPSGDRFPSRNHLLKTILSLRQQVFGDLDPVQLMPETWQWQFRDNPAGESACALAEDRNRIVGQYALIPTRFSVRGKETLFALSCDTMIHPDYHRQGLFTALARKVYQRIESEGRIATVWGFPNEASITGFTQHLEWRLLTIFPLRIAPLRPLTILRTRLGLKKGATNMPAGRKRDSDAKACASIPGLQVEPVNRFDTDYDELWNRHRGIAPVIQIRDAAYLRWRYADIPGFGYRAFAIRSSGRLLGYMVIRTLTLMGHFFGVLTDIFPFPVRDSLTTQHLFRFAREYCRAEGAEFMTCLLSRAEAAFFKSAGLKAVPPILNSRKWHLGARYAPSDASVLGVPENWYLTYGDTDIV